MTNRLRVLGYTADVMSTHGFRSSASTILHEQGLSGGFYKSDLTSVASKGSALLVLLSEDLEDTQSIVENVGGKISTQIFSFPGGRRFHFIEPSGNEFAIWSLTGT